jgi:hypothetical protein
MRLWVKDGVEGGREATLPFFEQQCDSASGRGL